MSEPSSRITTQNTFRNLMPGRLGTLSGMFYLAYLGEFEI
jgi:hypothetical protein